ncbi:FxLYD domain-containing protein [Clostridium tertium]|uniref:FxLYD domain-containing protein n=1 Tax=Clostridium tertium TaxID=1559 RepID=UPI00356244E8
MDNEGNNQENLTNEENINTGNEEKIELTEKVANEKFNIKKFIKTKRGKISLGVASVLIITFIVIMSQYPMSLNKAYKEYSTRFDTLGSDEAYKWLREEFDGKGLFGEKELVRSAQVLNKSLEEISKSIEMSTGGTVDDINSVEISEVWFEAGGKYSNYKDINTKIINKSKKNIKYIKLNIYFKDDNGNIIGSDWTNDDSIIKPNATQTISKMISKDVKNASVEIADIKFQ